MNGISKHTSATTSTLENRRWGWLAIVGFCMVRISNILLLQLKWIAVLIKGPGLYLIGQSLGTEQLKRNGSDSWQSKRVFMFY